MAADIAEVLSSSKPAGRAEARARPSGLTKAAPCTSGVPLTKFWRTSCRAETAIMACSFGVSVEDIEKIGR
jgi:hypothetical protein